MKTLLFLAVFALATQVQMSEVTEFYRTFLNNMSMDVQAKSYFMDEGLNCLNWATDFIVSSVQNLDHDVHNGDIVTTMRHAIGAMQVLEKKIVPQCLQTGIDLLSYIDHKAYIHRHDDNSDYYNSNYKIVLFQAKLIQLFAKVAADALNQRPDAAAKDLAIFISTGFGFLDAELPTTLEFDHTKFVPLDEKKAVPEFLKGFFTTLGVNDLAKINATSQCAIDVIATLKTLATNPTLQRGDFYTRANAFLDSSMIVTDAFERCKRLDMVDTAIFKRLVQMVKQYPALSIFRIFTNTVFELPTITETEINMAVYMSEGQYEIAGRLYAMNVRTVYDGVMF